MIVDIRGGLGTQVIELLGHYALAIDKDYSIQGIRINVGSVVQEGRCNYVTKIFDCLPTQYIVDDTKKLGVFQKPELLHLIIKHHKEIKRRLPLKVMARQCYLFPVMHVRTGNRVLVPLERYIDYATSNPVCVIGNIKDDYERVPGIQISRSPTEDWFAAFHSPETISTPSTFILSTLFVDPTRRAAIWDDEEGPVWEEMKPLLDKLKPKFPNLRWLH